MFSESPPTTDLGSPMKFPLCILALMLCGEAYAGPWYSFQLGHTIGDAVENPIPHEERVYVFRRATDSDDPQRGANILIRIFKAQPHLTLGQIFKELSPSFPSDFPKNFFVELYRDDNSSAGYHENAAKTLSSTRLIQRRDVIWIGFSK